MSDFDLVVTGTVVLADRIIEDGWAAVRANALRPWAVASRLAPQFAMAVEVPGFFPASSIAGPQLQHQGPGGF